MIQLQTGHCVIRSKTLLRIDKSCNRKEMETEEGNNESLSDSSTLHYLSGQNFCESTPKNIKIDRPRRSRRLPEKMEDYILY